jgi:hypothetical protein
MVSANRQYLGVGSGGEVLRVVVKAHSIEQRFRYLQTATMPASVAGAVVTTSEAASNISSHAFSVAA